MPAGRLRLALQPLDEIGPTGAEHVELRFAANPGEAERPLAKVASGGELSRVLLAVVVVLADRRDRTALLFDEIDAGIGGATATAVGVRLARLARSAQVVCVTHLAQIASYGDAHLVLRKHVAGGATTIDADELGDAQRPAEIARMLAGEERGVALAHAVELLAAREAAR
jgi:DNA repair protein RecN (Recombination protein N)